MTFTIHNMDANSSRLKLVGEPKLWNGTWSAPPPATIDNAFAGTVLHGFSARITDDPKAPPGINGSVSYFAPANASSPLHRVFLGFAALVQSEGAAFVVEAVYQTVDGPLFPHVAMVGDEYTYAFVFARAPNGPSSSSSSSTRAAVSAATEMPMAVVDVTELREGIKMATARGKK